MIEFFLLFFTFSHATLSAEHVRQVMHRYRPETFVTSQEMVVFDSKSYRRYVCARICVENKDCVGLLSQGDAGLSIFILHRSKNVCVWRTVLWGVQSNVRFQQMQEARKWYSSISKESLRAGFSELEDSHLWQTLPT